MIDQSTYNFRMYKIANSTNSSSIDYVDIVEVGNYLVVSEYHMILFM